MCPLQLYIATDETAQKGLSKPRDKGGKIDFDPSAPGTHGDHSFFDPIKAVFPTRFLSDFQV